MRLIHLAPAFSRLPLVNNVTLTIHEITQKLVETITLLISLWRNYVLICTWPMSPPNVLGQITPPPPPPTPRHTQSGKAWSMLRYLPRYLLELSTKDYWWDLAGFGGLLGAASPAPAPRSPTRSHPSPPAPSATPSPPTPWSHIMWIPWITQQAGSDPKGSIFRSRFRDL